MTGHDQAPSFKEMERDGWHERAGLYDDYAGRLTTEATARLLDAVGAIPKKRLLDVCCGPGYGAGAKQQHSDLPLSASTSHPQWLQKRGTASRLLSFGLAMLKNSNFRIPVSTQ